MWTECPNPSKEKLAVDNVSLMMGVGSVLALLGPNGADKTTLTDMMCGDMEPDSDAIFVKGSRVQKDAQVTRRNVGGKSFPARRSSFR